MIRRILVIGGLGLAAAGGARFCLIELRSELTERRWERRRQELLELAVFPPQQRRPWEVRFESLAQRVGSSPRIDEILRSPYRPVVTLGTGEPHGLDDFERVWLESLWNEFAGLDGVLAELRKLPLDELDWHGEAQTLFVSRELTNALCGRAWLAVERGDSGAAAEAFADALRLTRATTDGTAIATMVLVACNGITLRSMRSVLARGASPSALREAVAPLLEGWAYDPARGELVVRRELAFARNLEGVDEPADVLRWFAPVERALELAHSPVERVARLHAEHTNGRGSKGSDGGLSDDGLWSLGFSVSYLHALHAQRNVALTALAVAVFREEHGEFPAASSELSDLEAEHALDPLSGAPLPYSLSDDGARIGPAEWGTRVDTRESIDDSLYLWTLR